MAARRNFDIDRGVRQFLEIGSGLPTTEAVHEVAQNAGPVCRVVYVDYDRVVLAHDRAVLEGSGDGALVVDCDMRYPAGIIAAAQGLLDLSEPRRGPPAGSAADPNYLFPLEDEFLIRPYGCGQLYAAIFSAVDIGAHAIRCFCNSNPVWSLLRPPELLG